MRTIWVAILAVLVVGCALQVPHIPFATLFEEGHPIVANAGSPSTAGNNLSGGSVIDPTPLWPVTSSSLDVTRILLLPPIPPLEAPVTAVDIAFEMAAETLVLPTLSTMWSRPYVPGLSLYEQAMTRLSERLYIVPGARVTGGYTPLGVPIERSIVGLSPQVPVSPSERTFRFADRVENFVFSERGIGRVADSIALGSNVADFIHSMPSEPIHPNITLEENLALSRWGGEGIALVPEAVTTIAGIPNIWGPSIAIGTAVINSYWRFTGNLMTANNQMLQTNLIGQAFAASPVYGAQMLQRLQIPRSFELTVPNFALVYSGRFIDSTSFWKRGPLIFSLPGIELGGYHFQSTMTTHMSVGSGSFFQGPVLHRPFTLGGLQPIQGLSPDFARMLLGGPVMWGDFSRVMGLSMSGYDAVKFLNTNSNWTEQMLRFQDLQVPRVSVP